MSFKKQILFYALIFSFHGAIISMETRATQGINEQVQLINDYTDKVFHESNELVPLGNWLAARRMAIKSDKAWNNLINCLLRRIDTYGALKKIQAEAVKSVIKKNARDLKPGKNCSAKLSNEAKEAAWQALLIGVDGPPVFRIYPNHH